MSVKKNVITESVVLNAIEFGVTQADLAQRLGVSRQAVHDYSRKHGITWPERPTHVHGPGRMPDYRAGCPDCREIRARIARERRSSALRDSSQTSADVDALPDASLPDDPAPQRTEADRG